MIRSVSQTQLGSRNLERSYSKQCIYINQQSVKKTQKNSFSTIFHSPFKDGRKNKDFNNPSFMSSDLFYPTQYVKDKQNTPKKAIIHTQSQRRQTALYNNRMRKSASFRNIGQIIRQNSKSIQKRSMLKIGQRQKCVQKRQLKTVNAPQGLQNQLQVLINYRKNRQLRQQNKNISRKQSQVPIYFQQNRKYISYEQMCLQKRRNDLQEWVELTNQLSSLKKQIKKQLSQQQNRAVSKTTQVFSDYQNIRQKNSRKNAHILSNILKQQIRQNQAKKQKQTSRQKQKNWKFF